MPKVSSDSGQAVDAHPSRLARHVARVYAQMHAQTAKAWACASHEILNMFKWNPRSLDMSHYTLLRTLVRPLSFCTRLCARAVVQSVTLQSGHADCSRTAWSLLDVLAAGLC